MILVQCKNKNNCLENSFNNIPLKIEIPILWNYKYENNLTSFDRYINKIKIFYGVPKLHWTPLNRPNLYIDDSYADIEDISIWYNNELESGKIEKGKTEIYFFIDEDIPLIPIYRFVNAIDSLDNDKMYFVVKQFDQNNQLEYKWIQINKLIEKMDKTLLNKILTSQNISGGISFEEWINE